jgi:hypothetical protein
MAESKREESKRTEPGYSRVTWYGQQRYQCDTCPYDTADEGLMKTHQAQPSHQE